jgi:shikimate kinase
MNASANPHIVEIVGLAGAGKTALSHAMTRMDAHVHLGRFPDVRKISNAPFFLWNGLQTSLALPHPRDNQTRKLTRREFAWMCILRGWPKRLTKSWDSDELIILDQGPVYLLTELCEFGPEYLKINVAEEYWSSLCTRWAQTLDAIIWLDGRDEDLMARIRHRDKEHIVKRETDEATIAFLERYRRAYAHLILKLTMAHPDLPIFRFNSSQFSPEQIAANLLLELDLV